VEETLNGLLEAEADALCQARRYKRNAQRAGTRAGHYARGLQTKAGTVQLNVPKLRHIPFETAIIERYRRRESSVEEALVEMYLAGVSVRRVEDITEALWGSRVSPSIISGLNQKIFERVEAWRKRPLEAEYPYVFVDGIWLKRSWGGEVQNVSVLVAIGVSTSGFREIQRLEKAAGILESGCDETLSYYAFPVAHWRHIRTNNPLERLNREIRRRTRVVGSFPDGHAALMLVAARLRYMAGQKWGTGRYMNMKQEIAA
jgi:transposase-like protein